MPTVQSQLFDRGEDSLLVVKQQGGPRKAKFKVEKEQEEGETEERGRGG